jgi:vacuolar protein sorting-associated protein 13A/C
MLINLSIKYKRAVTKPMVGFLDMASNITAGIRETTTVFEGGDITRERLPRFTGRDGIVTVST